MQDLIQDSPTRLGAVVTRLSNLVDPQMTNRAAFRPEKMLLLAECRVPNSDGNSSTTEHAFGSHVTDSGPKEPSTFTHHSVQPN
jgi:hypothetical protein